MILRALSNRIKCVLSTLILLQMLVPLVIANNNKQVGMYGASFRLFILF